MAGKPAGQTPAGFVQYAVGKAVKLAELIAEISELNSGSLPELDIASIEPDSRRVRPGALFVAIRGTNDDGHRYLAQAQRAGAVAAVGQDPAELDIPYLRVEDSRLAYAELAAAWHGRPARQLVMVGVTGTDGKTTTAALLFEIMQQAGLASGLISTVMAQIGGQRLDTGLHVTTPDPMDLQALLARMVEGGLTHCVLETTSHGLAQHRVAGCEFDIGVVTNITHEHLDFHGSYEAYREAKGRLFSGLSESRLKSGAPEKLAVLNRDDPAYDYLRRLTKVRATAYGFHPEAEVRGERLAAGRAGLELLISTAGREFTVRSPMLGAYNASNILAALAVAVLGLGIDVELAVRAVEAFDGVPGRMQRIDLGQPFSAIVDFAHTPNALRAALKAARSLTTGKLIAVFGSAGLRDRAKRRMMAEASAELADLSVLTAEDPRTEPLEAILAEMAEGAKASGGVEQTNFWRVPDRGEAIRFAMQQAEPDDLVIVCGKGHEQSMCFGEIEYPWDDRTATRAALSELLGIEGPDMPELPTNAAEEV